MTNETSYLSAMNELFRWDAAGKLIFVEPILLRQITESLRDEQGLTVWERLDGCDRALVQLTSQVTALQQQYAQMQNDLSLLPSIQRSYMDLEKRLVALEGGTPKPAQFLEVLTDASLVRFDSIAGLVGQVEKMFDCRDGYYGSYHQVGDQTFPYTTLGLLALVDTVDAQEHLRQALYASFVRLKKSCKSERPTLYWRYAKEMRIQEEEGNIHGGLHSKNAVASLRHKIRTRIAIPEADFSVIDTVVPEGATYSTLRE